MPFPTPPGISPEELLNRIEGSRPARRSSSARSGGTSPRVQINRSTRGTAANGSRPARRVLSNGEKHSADSVMNYEIYTAQHPDVQDGKRPADELLVELVKREVNAAQIRRRDLYDFVGSDATALFTNENQAYNLDYGLRQRASITLECANRWLAVLGKRLGVIAVPIDADPALYATLDLEVKPLPVATRYDFCHDETSDMIYPSPAEDGGWVSAADNAEMRNAAEAEIARLKSIITALKESSE